jgi:hypothetical protein
MTKLTGEQIKFIEDAIKKYNAEAEILTNEYKKVKESIEYYDFDSDEEYEEKLGEASFSYKEKIGEKVWKIIGNILAMFDVMLVTNGYTILNNLEIYTIESLDSNDFKVEITCDDSDSNKIISYEIM